MKQPTLALFLILATVPVSAIAQAPPQNSAPQDPATQAAQNAPQFQSASLRILHPRPGQALKNTFVNLRFELMQPNPGGGDNNFVVQLDALEPVNTSDTTYTFSGLRPGQHIIMVSEVDANGTPLPGRIAEVHFSVEPPDSPATPAPGGGQPSSKSEK
jgi:hypothetical protein